MGNLTKKNRKVGIVIVLILIISIITLSVVYATLSATLTIDGIGTVNASNWDISFKNSTIYSNSTTGAATYTTPTIEGTTISNYSVSLSKPGDSVTLYFDIKNEGDFNAEIALIINDTPVCTSKTGNESDASLVCDNLDVKLKYATNAEIIIGDVLNIDSYTCENQTTIGYEETTLKLTITLNSNMTSVPGSEVTISNLKHTIIYVQTEKECESDICFEGKTKISTKEGFKEIKDIKEGDLVYSINLDNNKKELKTVVNTFKRETRLTSKIKTKDNEIETTSLHPFYVLNKGWISAKNIKNKDKLYNLKYKFIQVEEKNTKIYNQPIMVYNIEVEDNHNYLITEDEILVHNWELGCGETQEQ